MDVDDVKSLKDELHSLRSVIEVLNSRLPNFNAHPLICPSRSLQLIVFANVFSFGTGDGASDLSDSVKSRPFCDRYVQTDGLSFKPSREAWLEEKFSALQVERDQEQHLHRIKCDKLVRRVTELERENKKLFYAIQLHRSKQGNGSLSSVAPAAAYTPVTIKHDSSSHVVMARCDHSQDVATSSNNPSVQDMFKKEAVSLQAIIPVGESSHSSNVRDTKEAEQHPITPHPPHDPSGLSATMDSSRETAFTSGFSVTHVSNNSNANTGTRVAPNVTPILHKSHITAAPTPVSSGTWNAAHSADANNGNGGKDELWT